MKKYAVTISREYGSGGRLIGKKLAEELGISFYDKEIIEMLVKESGFPLSTIEEWVEKKTPVSFYEVYMPIRERPVPDQIYMMKTKMIQDLADQESCVIVGNCGDYILKDDPNCFRVFVYAPMEEKIARVRDVYKEEAKNYEAYIKQIDKQRANYYNYFTMSKWGERQNYHISINSTVGIDRAVTAIRQIIEQFMEE